MTAITEVPGQGRAVALTFDDGPGPYTQPILDILARFDVRATFFMCGASVRRHPQLVRAVVTAGHLIGNHTFHHPQRVAGSRPYGHFDELDPSIQLDELDRTDTEIAQALGHSYPI